MGEIIKMNKANCRAVHKPQECFGLVWFRLLALLPLGVKRIYVKSL